MRSEALIQLLVAESGQQRTVRKIGGADLRQDAGERLVAAAFPKPPMEIEILARAPVQVLVLRMLTKRLGQALQIAHVVWPKIPASQPERIRLELQSNRHHFTQAVHRKFG